MSYVLIGDIEEDFSESDLPIRVDVLDWARVNERFREIIRQDHAVLLPAGKAARGSRIPSLVSHAAVSFSMSLPSEATY